MRIKPTFFLLLVFTQVFLGGGAASAAISFVPGNYYTSYSDVGLKQTITQYNAAGNVVGALTVSYGSELRGLTFGPDNLLYATVLSGSDPGFTVVALNSAGVAQRSYSGSAIISGVSSYGKIALDGQYLYVAGGDYLTRFLLSNPSSGTTIYTKNTGVLDVEPLPNGNLLVASANQIQEITTAGSVIRTISLVNGNGDFFYAIRGIEYNAATNDLFVAQLGYSDFAFKVLRVDATTGVLETNTTFNYADDLFLTASGELLAGSRTLSPVLYGQDLTAHGTLQGGQQQFVTQFVPEPSIALLLAASAFPLLLRRRRG